MAYSDQPRSTAIGYDRCQKNFNFKFKELDGKGSKLCVTTKASRHLDDLVRILLLLVSRCEQGSSLAELIEYRNQLFQWGAQELDAAVNAESQPLKLRFCPAALDYLGLLLKNLHRA